MNPALWASAGAATALALVLCAFAVAIVVGRRRRRAQEASARADVEALRAQVEELSSALASSQGAAEVPSVQAEYVITTAGDSDEGRDLPQVPDRAVLSVTLGEPLVKLTALGYGLRRALAPETRNRIAFEIRREVKRARKERRRAARRTRITRTHSEEAA